MCLLVLLGALDQHALGPKWSVLVRNKKNVISLVQRFEIPHDCDAHIRALFVVCLISLDYNKEEVRPQIKLNTEPGLDSSLSQRPCSLHWSWKKTNAMATITYWSPTNTTTNKCSKTQRSSTKWHSAKWKSSWRTPVFGLNTASAANTWTTSTVPFMPFKIPWRLMIPTRKRPLHWQSSYWDKSDTTKLWT